LTASAASVKTANDERLLRAALLKGPVIVETGTARRFGKTRVSGSELDVPRREIIIRDWLDSKTPRPNAG
jgi:hypothetical protein